MHAVCSYSRNSQVCICWCISESFSHCTSVQLATIVILEREGGERGKGRVLYVPTTSDSPSEGYDGELHGSCLAGVVCLV